MHVHPVFQNPLAAGLTLLRLHLASGLLFGLLMFSTALFGQVNWQPATLILADGTERSGEVADRGWTGEIQSISFREAPSKVATEYSPEDLQSFSLGDATFFSREVEVDGAPGREDQLKANVDYPSTRTRGFLQMLIGGPMSLYVYAGPDQRKHYFIQSPIDDNPIYLPYRPRLTGPETAPRFRASAEFRKVLAVRLTGDCENLTESIGQARYRQEDFTSIVNKYYACTETSPDYRVSVPKTRFHLGVTAGLAYTGIWTSDILYDNVLDGSTGFLTSYGIRAKIMPPIRNYRTSIVLGLVRDEYTTAATDAENLEINGSSADHEIKAVGYQAQLGLGYTVYQGSVSLGLRGSFDYGFGRKDTYDRETFVDGESTFVYPTKAIDGGHTFSLGGGITATYRRLEAAVMAQFGKRQAPERSLYRTRGVGLTLSYYLL